VTVYHFGLGRGRVDYATSRRVDEIAAEHGVDFVVVNLPGEGWRYWFNAPNRGEPFDRDLARAVLDALVAAGVALPGWHRQ
jgi:hypothetical protein